MPTQQERCQYQEMEEHKRDALNALIGEQVLHTLGKPDALVKVDVRLLWENYYRVNVILGADARSAMVAHSYFIGGDGDGHIVMSTPQIRNTY